jgi:hypothetical protein
VVLYLLDRGNKIASVLTWIGVAIIVASIILGVVLAANDLIDGNFNPDVNQEKITKLLE